MKNPEKLNIEDVARKLRWPTKEWHGECYSVACAIVKAKLVNGRAVYGHYLGPVARTGYWADRRGQAFQRHGWIVLKDGRILDPTRWSFEDKEPYLYLFDPTDTDAAPCKDCPHRADEHSGGTFFLPCDIPGCSCESFDPKESEYDEGGNKVREGMMKPIPEYRKPGKDADQFEKNRLKHIRLKLKPRARSFLTNLFNEPPAFTWEMVHWVANLPPSRLSGHAKEIFQSIVDAGNGCSIPIDNRRAVLGD